MIMGMGGLSFSAAIAPEYFLGYQGGETTFSQGKISKTAELVNDKFEVTLTAEGESISVTNKLDIVIVLDNSNSMLKNGGQEAANDAIDSFVNSLLPQYNDSVRIGLLSFWGINNKVASYPKARVPLTTNVTDILNGRPSRSDSSNGQGGTFTQNALIEAATMFDNSDSSKVIILLSDGAPTYSFNGSSVSGNGSEYTTQHGTRTKSAATTIKNSGITIYSIGIAFGTTTGAPEATARQLLKDISSNTTNVTNYYLDAYNVSLVNAMLALIGGTVTKTIVNGTITDPIGECFELEGNPVLTKSAGAEATLQAVTGDTIRVTDITLGEGDTLTLKYTLILKTECHDGNPKPMNGDTTLAAQGFVEDFKIPTGGARPEQITDPTGCIEIFKKDDTGEISLEGAVFEIYKDGTLHIEEAITDDDGMWAICGLELGTYTVKEITPPDGYQFGKITEKTVIIESNKLNHELYFYNPEIDKTPDPTGSITITKIDSETKSPLAGAEFEVKMIGSTEGITGITESNGVVEFNDLPYGEYIITELEAPSGYIKDNNISNVTLDVEITSVEIYVENDPEVPEPGTGKIEIYKYDNKTEKGLAGAVFEIRQIIKSGDQPEGPVAFAAFALPALYTAIGTTDKNGDLVFTNVPYGCYEVRELTAPQDYEAIDTVFEVCVYEGDDGYQPVGNEKIPGGDDEDNPPPPVKDDETPERPRRPRRPRPERPAVPETPDVPEIQDVDEEPIPEAPVLPPVIDEVVEVPEEPVPQATLPKTGAVNPAIASGLGALIIGLGLVLRKKED